MNPASVMLGAFLLVAASLVQPIRGNYCPPVPACAICQEDSTCVGTGAFQSCECQPGLKGKSDFDCYQPANKSVCHIMNDPAATSLNGYFAHTDFFGSAKLVHLITDADTPAEGVCHLRLHGWTTKVQGKFFLKGLYFRHTYTPDGGMRQETTGGVYGEQDGCGTYYHYFLQKQPNPAPIITGTASPSTHSVGVLDTEAGPCPFKFSLIAGGFLEISNDCCGIKFALRVFNDYYPNIIPGMFFEVCQDHNPTFYCWNIKSAPLCLETAPYGTNYTTLSAYTQLDDYYSSLVYFSMVSSFYKSYPLAPSKLGFIKRKLITCPLPRLNQMFLQAKFIFASPHFIRCIAGNDEEYGDVLALVLRYYCDEELWACTDLVEIINDKCLFTFAKIVGIVPFLDLNCTL